MHSPTQSTMPAHSIAIATAVLTTVALGCILALSVLSGGDHDQRLRPLSSRRMFRGTNTIDQVRRLRPVAFIQNIARRRMLSNDEDSDIPANHAGKQGHQGSVLSLALVRPISVRDAEALVNSFVYWDEFPPSTNKDCHSCGDDKSANIDIIISFSREFDEKKYPDINEAMETVRSLFEKTNGWGGCIQSIKMFEANIRPEEDLYDPLLAEQGNRMWANGPNRQFERTFRYVQSLDMYDAMFLMESDTYPAADGWLDLLVEEVKSSAPFALLGSKYNGHAWDDFAEQMPLALLHHINGNAIYNTTHPILEQIVSELENEADTWYNAITYDYRISQILLEGSTGASPDFPHVNVVDEGGNQIKLLPKTEKFRRWWKEYPDTHQLVQESNVMTNLGSTAFLPGDVEDGIALVHGKNMYLPWNSSIHGNVSLVVSDWGEMNELYKDFLSKLNAIDHPYSEIVLVATLESEEFINNFSEWCNSTINLPVLIQNRTHDETMDLCDAEPTTDYFVLTDVGHVPREKIELLVASDGSNRPVVPFVSTESVHCSSYKSCDDVIQDARQDFFASADRFVFSSDMIFRRDFVQKYCGELLRSRNRGRSVAPLAPTATSYIAYLQRIDIAESYYAFSDIVIEGSMKNFVPADPKVPLAMRYHAADASDREGIEFELPVLWHIPKSGGSSLKTLLSHCLGLTVASSSGVMIERRRGIIGENEFSDHLHTVKSGVATFASVDVSSPNGIVRARDLDLVGSGISEALVTPLLYRAAADLFSAEIGRRARIFSVMRHPVERAVSLFYYLQNATWERTYDPSLRNMTLEEYAISEKSESNWMVRMLNNEPAAVDERHLNVAKEILKDKILIGLTEKMEESVERFYSYYGWEGSKDSWSSCEQRLLFGGGTNSNHHQKVEEGAEAWDLLVSRNQFDVALYEYAVKLYSDQAVLYKPNPAVMNHSNLRPNPGSDADDEVHQMSELNIERQLDSNVADGEIVPFDTSLPFSCLKIRESEKCVKHENCIWVQTSRVCKRNIFGHRAVVAPRKSERPGCVRLKSQQKVLRCFKLKKRSCRMIKNRNMELKCIKLQRKRIGRFKKACLQQSRKLRVGRTRGLRVLSLGGSVTWGSHLDDRSYAYPSLLSGFLPGKSSSTNVAMRESGSDYASICLQSMVTEAVLNEQDSSFDHKGQVDTQYDVITIEYSLNGLQALPRLLKRLRARYPGAFLLYVNLYSWRRSVIETTSKEKAYEILKRDGLLKSTDRIYIESNGTFHLNWEDHLSLVKQNIERIMKRVGGVVYNWPLPNNPLDDLSWFTKDLHHLNDAGHRRLAQNIATNIINNYNGSTIPTKSFGQWGTKKQDQCSSWYNSGISKNIEMNREIIPFAPGMYAIEATSTSDPITITFDNDFNETLSVGLRIMAHQSMYPKSVVRVRSDSTANVVEDLFEVLDPSSRVRAGRDHHLVQTYFVGHAEPGRITVSIIPTEDSDWPLRITGVLVCSDCGMEKVSDRWSISASRKEMRTSSLTSNSRPLQPQVEALKPELGFTNLSMSWEDIHGRESPSLTLLLKGKRQLSWQLSSTDGNFQAKFRTREDISFRIGRYRNKNGLPPTCDSGRSGGVLVWIESVNNDVVLSAPALCLRSGDDLLARAQIQDPGEYRIHIVGYDLSVLGTGAHGTVATILPARNSPWTFLVQPEAVAIPSLASAPTVFNFPLRFCEFSDLEVSGEGRWIQCAAAGVPPSRCLSDGWIYVPRECSHRITQTVDALKQAKEIVDKRGGKPLWIVFTGSSVDRGTFHALVDHVAAIGMIEDGMIKRSVADAIFQNVEDQRGRGSTSKCWGWIDIQVGSLRLSYQDARLHMMRDDQHWITQTKDRWKELLSEGPDLMVLGLEGHSNTPDDLRAYDLATYQIVEAAAATNFTGLIAINPTKKRILNGGIKNAYECSSGGIRSSIENVRSSLLKAFGLCEICRDLDKKRFVVSDELLMGWSFLFNMERPMSNEIASQHFHRYVTDALPRPSCGSKHTNRRYVIGAVTEMAAQIYLGTVLSRLNKELEISIQDESSHDHLTTTEDWEFSLGETHPFRACFTCPYSALPWKPPTSPSATLSDETLANAIETFDASRFDFAPSTSRGIENASLAFCYE